MLPNDFIQILKKTYPKDYSKILQTFNNKYPTTFRVNTIKSNIQKVQLELREKGIIVKEGPFLNSFVVINDKKELISKTNLVDKGFIYMQELASMIPPLILNPKENEYILDLTSAPGSKTTQICALVNNKAKILANEKSYVRYQKLLFNLKLQNCTSVKTVNFNGMFLFKKYPEFINFFDKILLDTPCSNEGRFNTNNPKTYKYWSKNKIKEMTNVQRGLLVSAIKMLKPGGKLVYSTCTINPYENEQNINWAINKYKNIKIEQVDLQIDNQTCGLTEFENLKFNSDLSKTLRLLPNKYFGAFFVAKLTKKLE